MQKITGNSPLYSCSQSTIFYNMVGNFIPPEWQYLSDSSGKILSKTSRQLLSVIVSCFESGINIESMVLQESYYFFETRLGVGQRRVRQCFDELQKAGVLTVELLTIIKHYIKCRNILSIKLLKTFKKVTRSNMSYSCGDCRKIKNFPYNMQEFLDQGEEDFRLNGKDFSQLNIIDNNISILKSRSTKSDFSNFLEEDLEKNDFSKKITLENEQKVFPGVEAIDQEALQSPLTSSNSASWLDTIASKTRNILRFKKNLAEFYPLKPDDAHLLQIQSGRGFNLNFINLLLLKLGKQYPQHSFFSRKSFLNYMSKVLAYEMRDAVRVNNESFRFKQDAATEATEEYLQEIEDSKDTSQISRLKRKIAAVFEPRIAYALLNSCSFLGSHGSSYSLRLLKNIELSKTMQDILLREIKAVMGNQINELKIIPKGTTSAKELVSRSIHETLITNDHEHLQGLGAGSAWLKIREYLIEKCGVHTDKNWFSKLEVTHEDHIGKKLILKPQSNFFGDWIMQNYATTLEHAFAAQGFIFEMASCD